LLASSTWLDGSSSVVVHRSVGTFGLLVAATEWSLIVDA